MTPLSVRMVIIFVMVVAFLNFSNYTFMRFYNPPIPLKTGYNKYATKASRISSPLPTQITLNSNSWADKLLCEVNASLDPNCKNRHITTQVTMYYNEMYDPDRSEPNLCPEMPPGLGPIEDDSAKSLETFATMYSDIEPGGIYNTTACESRHSVAIIVPFRGLKSSLASFLYVLHPFLMKQQLNYQIFIVEQSNTSQPFNRGKLLNVGFTEARRRRHHWDCFVFHEPNIVPMDSRNLYRCSWYPRQLAIRVERPFRPPYQPKIGGAFAVTVEQFLKINGFSNTYWGNDADYDDLYQRLKVANYVIESSIRMLGKYKSLRNVNTPARITSQMTETISPLYLLDGLTTLSYTINKIDLRPIYTHIIVNIDETDESLTDSKVWSEILNQPTRHTTSRQTQAVSRSQNMTTSKSSVNKTMTL